jgi:hypothetical protein
VGGLQATALPPAGFNFAVAIAEHSLQPPLLPLGAATPAGMQVVYERPEDDPVGQVAVLHIHALFEVRQPHVQAAVQSHPGLSSALSTSHRQCRC